MAVAGRAITQLGHCVRGSGTEAKGWARPVSCDRERATMTRTSDLSQDHRTQRPREPLGQCQQSRLSGNVWRPPRAGALVSLVSSEHPEPGSPGLCSPSRSGKRASSSSRLSLYAQFSHICSMFSQGPSQWGPQTLSLEFWRPYFLILS